MFIMSKLRILGKNDIFFKLILINFLQRASFIPENKVTKINYWTKIYQSNSNFNIQIEQEKIIKILFFLSSYCTNLKLWNSSQYDGSSM